MGENRIRVTRVGRALVLVGALACGAVACGDGTDTGAAGSPPGTTAAGTGTSDSADGGSVADSAGATDTTTPSPSSAEGECPATPESDTPLGPDTVADWTVAEGDVVRMPDSASSGPFGTAGDTECYAHSPTGATLALVRMVGLVQAGMGRAAEIRGNLTGPGAGDFTSPQDGSQAVRAVDAARVDGYTPDEATVSVLFAQETGGAAATYRVRWLDGTWKVETSDARTLAVVERPEVPLDGAVPIAPAGG